jgi:hypothetical protein
MLSGVPEPTAAVDMPVAAGAVALPVMLAEAACAPVAACEIVIPVEA